jgi:hypothetical protein
MILFFCFFFLSFLAAEVNVLWHFHRRNGEVSGFMRILILDVQEKHL